jgi:hypothetical protein
MFDLILRQLMGRYGHLSLEEMKVRLREDGLEELLEATKELMTNDPELVERLSELSPFGPSVDEAAGVMLPTAEVETLSVELDDDIYFDQKACLRSCAGTCCKSKNYLMISIADIYQIISSPAAKLLDVHSTSDLFGRDPPLVQSFFNSEYGLFLPYLRYGPVGADPDVLPEDAPGSVCPFLFPINKVYSFYEKRTPQWASKEAQGCILGRNKPRVCRLSPVGVFAGLVTGRTSHEYVAPALDCPACETDVTVKLADYLAQVELPGEKEQQARHHRIVMKAAKRDLDHREQQRYGEILQQLYNVDELLLRHGVDLQHRPVLDQLIEIGAMAARGDFEPYEEFVEELTKRGC